MKISGSTTNRANYTQRNTANEIVIETENNKAPDEGEPSQESTQTTQDVKGDTVEISQEAKQKSKDINDQLQEMSDKLKWLEEQLEAARAQAQGAADRWEVIIKCLKIAMRIISGNIVPRADHRYLAKNDPELYSKAITMRMPKENPKKYKRISKDEKPQKPEKAGESEEKNGLQDKVSQIMPEETEEVPAEDQ